VRSSFSLLLSLVISRISAGSDAGLWVGIRCACCTTCAPTRWQWRLTRHTPATC
jgi:hypothetical protein